MHDVGEMRVKRISLFRSLLLANKELGSFMVVLIFGAPLIFNFFITNLSCCTVHILQMATNLLQVDS